MLNSRIHLIRKRVWFKLYPVNFHAPHEVYATIFRTIFDEIEREFVS